MRYNKELEDINALLGNASEEWRRRAVKTARRRNVWNKIKEFFKTCGKYILAALLFLPLMVKFIVDKSRDNRTVSEHYRERNDSVEESTNGIQSTVGDIEASIEDIGESEREVESRIESAQDGIRRSEDHADNILSAVERIRELLSQSEENQ